MMTQSANGSRLVVEGGTIATADGCVQSDVLCEDGRITALGIDFARRPGDKVLDARSLFVLPGGIDVHTHFDEPFMGCVTADDFTTGGQAAIAGGVTSHVDFAYQFKGESLHEAVGHWHARARGRAVIDYGFHIVISDVTEEVKAEIPAMIESGYPTFKIFMTYPGLAVDDGGLMDVMRIATRHGGRVSVHAENYFISERLIEELHRLGHFEPRFHPSAHPWQSEFEATVRAMAIAEIAGAPLYVVHVSAAPALEAVRQARVRGQKVTAETSISYLALTHEVYDQEGMEPAKYVCTPPVRSKENRESLWSHLAAGDIQVVGSDHDPFSFADRVRLGGDDFAKIPNGIAGVEQIRPILWSEGVRPGRLSIEQFVSVTATNAAKTMGLWPRKGTIAVGSDADLVLWDPDKEVVLDTSTTHSAADYCVYEGRAVKGYATTTVSRGEVVMENGILSAEQGRGEFLPRRGLAFA